MTSPTPAPNAVILSEGSRGILGEPPSKDPEGSTPTPGLSSFFTATLALFALALLFTTHASAQGCVQCLDTTRATPPAVQAAYRHAILLLASAAATIFTAGVLLLRRNR